jgi:hypothetical protein
MAHLDRLTLDHLASLLRTEYDPLVSSPTTLKQREMLFRYGLSEAALEAQRRSREARLRLRGLAPDLLRAWSDKVVA